MEIRHIGLLGKMGSGKSSLAKRLQREFGGFIVPLAEELKAQVINYAMVPDGIINKTRDRALLQDYGQLRRNEIEELHYHQGRVLNVGHVAYLNRREDGTNVFTEIGECRADYWVDKAIHKMLPLMQEGHLCVVDDIRRQNEITRLKSATFLIIKIQVDETLRSARLEALYPGFDTSRLDDISESTIDGLECDAIVENNATENDAWNTLLSVILNQTKV